MTTTATQDSPHPAASPAATDRDREALGEFLRAHRATADPARFPLTGHPTRASALRGVSQAQVAEALGVTEGYYRQIETGKRHLDTRYVESLVHQFQLSAVERAVLYRLSQGGEPDPPLTPLVVGARTRALIDALPLPAYAADAAWQIEHANAHLTDWLPPLRTGANVLLETATNPAMRRVLADYRQSWLRPLLGQLRERLTRATEPLAADLQTLADTVLCRNSDAARLWTTYPDTVYMHPADTVRPIHRHGAMHYVQLGTSNLGAAPMSTMTWLIPLGPATGAPADTRAS